MALNSINPYAHNLTNAESHALVKMIDKREQYVYQGRIREAHGAGTMILIFWKALHGFSDTMPTYHGEFE